MIRILCYGDSNAWGHIPAKGTRYPAEVRWPSVAGSILGSRYTMIEDSISGRTTMFEDPNLAGRNGFDCLKYSLLAHLPIDMIIIALGSNDLKFTDSNGSMNGLRALIDSVRHAEERYDLNAPLFNGEKRILLVGPPVIAKDIKVMRPTHALADAAGESEKLAKKVEQIAEEENTYYIDISHLVYPSTEDCLHLSPEDHRKIAKAMAAKITEIFG